MSTSAMSESHPDPTTADADSGLDAARLVALHRAMVLAQALDARLVAEARQGGLEEWRPGGAEAALVGAAAALGERDWLFAGPRDAAAALARGVALDVVLAHVFGTGVDPTKGRVHPERLALRAPPGPIAATGFHNGAHLTHAAGVAWGAKIKKEPTVALAFFDEDEIASGEFHNALNFAGVFKLPVVFVAVRRAAVAAGADTSGRGVAYGVPTVACDAGDVVAVHVAVREAVARARRGEGATLVEAAIVADEAPGVAIARLERSIAKKGGDAASAASAAREGVAALLDDAVAKAKAAAPASAETMFDDVYGTSSLPWHLAEEREALVRARRGT